MILFKFHKILYLKVPQKYFNIYLRQKKQIGTMFSPTLFCINVVSYHLKVIPKHFLARAGFDRPWRFFYILVFAHQQDQAPGSKLHVKVESSDKARLFGEQPYQTLRFDKIRSTKRQKEFICLLSVYEVYGYRASSCHAYSFTSDFR